MSGRVTIPTLPAGNEIAPAIQKGDLMEMGSGTGAGEYSNSETARHLKEMSIDSVRNSKLSLTGRPSTKMAYIKKFNKYMERIHDVSDRTADYIEQIATAKSRVKQMIKSFQDAFTGIWSHLKDFKVSDLWDIRRKWSRDFDRKIFGLNIRVQNFESYLYDIHVTREQFLNAYKELFGTDKYEEYYSNRHALFMANDTLNQYLDVMEQSALRALLINKSIDSVLNKKGPTSFDNFMGFIGTITLNEDLNSDNLKDMNDIELDLAKIACALKNDKNSYTDYMVIKSKLDRINIEMDKHLAALNQNEGYMKATLVQMAGYGEYQKAKAENAYVGIFKNGEIR